MQENDSEKNHRTLEKQRACHWIHAAGILTALWLMIVFLITAVEAVAYWTPGYYKMEYEKYQVLDCRK